MVGRCCVVVQITAIELNIAKAAFRKASIQRRCLVRIRRFVGLGDQGRASSMQLPLANNVFQENHTFTEEWVAVFK